MVLSNETDVELEEKQAEICTRLNLSFQISKDTWEHFQRISKNFTLEVRIQPLKPPLMNDFKGEPLHWIACAIYVACWRSNASTAAQNNVHSNCVHLTSLLRHCNLRSVNKERLIWSNSDYSIAQFFYKIKQWSDMANMPEEFKKRIEYLEESYAVAYNVFKEYQPLFLQIFKTPEAHESDLAKPRNRKHK